MNSEMNHWVFIDISFFRYPKDSMLISINISMFQPGSQSVKTSKREGQEKKGIIPWPWHRLVKAKHEKHTLHTRYPINKHKTYSFDSSDMFLIKNNWLQRFHVRFLYLSTLFHIMINKKKKICSKILNLIQFYKKIDENGQSSKCTYQHRAHNIS